MDAPGRSDLRPTAGTALRPRPADREHRGDAADGRCRRHRPPSPPNPDKSATIARRQLDAGAVGICVAKLSEAEALVTAFEADARTAGLDPGDVPTRTPGCRAPGRALAGKVRPCLVVDHPDGVAELSAATDGGPPLTVLCDIDVGLGRTGVTGPDPALLIAALVEGRAFAPFRWCPGLCRARPARGRPGPAPQFRRIGQRPDRRGGRCPGVGRSPRDHPHRRRHGNGLARYRVRRAHELQTGSYVFMDREYRDALGTDPESALGQSLTLTTTVISTNQTGFVTVDAGLKSMATDAGVPTVVGDPDSRFSFFGDEQGSCPRLGPGHPGGANVVPRYHPTATRPSTAQPDLAHPRRHHGGHGGRDRTGSLVLFPSDRRGGHKPTQSQHYGPVVGAHPAGQVCRATMSARRTIRRPTIENASSHLATQRPSSGSCGRHPCFKKNEGRFRGSAITAG